MTWVKVCGLTDAGDVMAAVNAGADAIGFVTVPASPRFVTLDAAAALAGGIAVETILLTLDLDPDEAIAAIDHAGVTGIQPYGEHRQEVATAAVAAGYRVLFPTKPVPGLDITALPGVPLVDTPSTTKLGGTGRSFDWDLVAGISGEFVLAGGLGPDNVVAAINQVRPWGVDASSGLEKSPGRKDHGMVADFINKAKMT